MLKTLKSLPLINFSKMGLTGALTNN